MEGEEEREGSVERKKYTERLGTGILLQLARNIDVARNPRGTAVSEFICENYVVSASVNFSIFSTLRFNEQ